MKAATCKKYGPPETLTIEEIERPTIQDHDVLVKVHATSVNPYEWHNLNGTPPARLETGLFKPKHLVIRADIAGAVEAVGRQVTQFQPGDDVFGRTVSGGFAEYACLEESRLAKKPTNLTFEEAAAVPLAALTALQGLRDKGNLQAGQTVLINGASGGIGTFAVQLAKSFGAEVTGVCSTRNVNLVRSIGADHVVDYTQEDFTQTGKTYDLILDTIGNRSFLDLKRALTPEGRGVIIGFSPGILFQILCFGPWMAFVGKQKIGPMLTNIKQADLLFLKDLLEAGKIKPVIDRRYPFHQIADAFRYLGERRAQGKVIVAM